MKCPKCGQETVNINDRDVCTICGIVYGGQHIGEQISDQLKANAFQKIGQAEREDYVSPVENELKQIQNQSVQTPKTAEIPDFPEKIHLSQSNRPTQTATLPKNPPPIPDFPGMWAKQKPSIYSGQQSSGISPSVTPPIQDRLNDAIDNKHGQTGESATAINNQEEGHSPMISTHPDQDLPSLAPHDLSPQKEMVLKAQSGKIIQPEPQVHEITSQAAAGSLENHYQTAPLNPIPKTAATQMNILDENSQFYKNYVTNNEGKDLYRSHEINFHLRIILFFIVLVVVCSLGYVIYLKSISAKGFIDGLIQYVGVSSFK